MPQDWKQTTLGKVLAPKGYIRGPFGSALRRNELLDSGIPIYEQQHAIYGVRDFRFFIDEKKFQEMKRFETRPNDLIISCSGTLGRVSIIRKEDPKGIISQALLLLRANSEVILPQYLQYFFSSKEGYNAIVSRSSGSVQVNISKRADIEQIPLAIPPIYEQKAIVETLGVLDAKIANNKKINHHLEQIAHAIFKSWFVDFEPFADATFIDSEIGKIPNGWRVASLSDVCHNITDGAHNTVVDDPNGEHLLLSCKNIKNGAITVGLTERRINEVTFRKLRNRTLLEKGDILITSVGTVGEMAILTEEPTNYEFQRSVAMIKPNQDIVSSPFLYESLHWQKAEIIHAAHGAVQQCLFLGDIRNFTILLPDKNSNQEYSTLVNPLFKKIASNRLENTLLTNVSDKLLPRLMSGELPVVNI